MFKVFRIHFYYMRLMRGLRIGWIFFGYFWVNWMSRSRLATKLLVPKRYRTNGNVIPTQKRLRMVIERLGPTFVKFGQVLADRPDIVSEKFREELRKLKSDADPFDHTLARQLIERELGSPIRAHFSHLGAKCSGSASIGQVYKATLLDGTHVVVKIQRPNIKEKIKLDLNLLEFFADKVSKEYPEFVVVDLTGVVKEFGETLMNELNYFNESSNAKRFREMFRKVPYCVIPKVYDELSTDKLLVMEDVQGIPAHNPEALKQHGLDPEIVVKHSINIFLKMVFENGFFHADMHSGNVFVLPDNKVALIDFGMAGSLKPSQMEFLARFSMGMATASARTISDALLTLTLNSSGRFFKDREDLEFKIQEMIDRYGTVPYEKIQFSQVLNECVRILLKFELKIPGTVYLIAKGLSSIEKLAMSVHADASIGSYVKPYARNLIQEQYSLSTIGTEIVEAAKDYMHLARTFPNEVSEILHKAKQGKLVHDIEIANQDFFRTSLRHLGRRIATVLIVGFMFVGSIIVQTWGTPTAFTGAMFIVSSILTFFLLLRLFFKTSM
jgi:ubiquinone biosynthesis protein